MCKDDMTTAYPLGRFATGAEHIFVRSSDAVEYAVEQQLAGNKGEKGPASAI